VVFWFTIQHLQCSVHARAVAAVPGISLLRLE
jgi:hypothetical protein